MKRRISRLGHQQNLHLNESSELYAHRLPLSWRKFDADPICGAACRSLVPQEVFNLHVPHFFNLKSLVRLRCKSYEKKDLHDCFLVFLVPAEFHLFFSVVQRLPQRSILSTGAPQRCSLCPLAVATILFSCLSGPCL